MTFGTNVAFCQRFLKGFFKILQGIITAIFGHIRYFKSSKRPINKIKKTKRDLKLVKKNNKISSNLDVKCSHSYLNSINILNMMLIWFIDSLIMDFNFEN